MLDPHAARAAKIVRHVFGVCPALKNAYEQNNIWFGLIFISSNDSRVFPAIADISIYAVNLSPAL